MDWQTEIEAFLLKYEEQDEVSKKDYKKMVDEGLYPFIQHYNLLKTNCVKFINIYLMMIDSMKDEKQKKALMKSKMYKIITDIINSIEEKDTIQ